MEILEILEIRDVGYCEMLVCACKLTRRSYAEYLEHPDCIILEGKTFYRNGWNVPKDEIYYLP